MVIIQGHSRNQCGSRNEISLLHINNYFEVFTALLHLERPVDVVDHVVSTLFKVLTDLIYNNQEMCAAPTLSIMQSTLQLCRDIPLVASRSQAIDSALMQLQEEIRAADKAVEDGQDLPLVQDRFGISANQWVPDRRKRIQNKKQKHTLVYGTPSNWGAAWKGREDFWNLDGARQDREDQRPRRTWYQWAFNVDIRQMEDERNRQRPVGARHSPSTDWYTSAAEQRYGFRQHAYINHPASRPVHADNNGGTYNVMR